MAAIKSVKLIRFLTGQEIIAEVLGYTENQIKVKNPVGIQLVPSQGNPSQPTVGLFNWIPFSDDKEIGINRDLVVIEINPTVEFLNQYNTMVGGLIVPDNKLIKA